MDSDELEKAYEAQLKRRDDEIAELKTHNEILTRTSIRQSDKILKLEKLLNEIEKKKG